MLNLVARWYRMIFIIVIISRLPRVKKMSWNTRCWCRPGQRFSFCLNHESVGRWCASCAHSWSMDTRLQLALLIFILIHTWCWVFFDTLIDRKLNWKHLDPKVQTMALMAALDDLTFIWLGVLEIAYFL